MREILFRGQTRRHGEKVWMNGEKVPSNWAYGGVCQGKGAFSIIYGSYDENLEAPTEKHVVYTDTLGQYTGLTDKNGKKIFEGDIVKTETDLYSGETKKERVTRIGVVVYDKMFCQFGLDIRGFSRCFTLKRWSGDFNEVVGNIHDNRLEDFEDGK